MAYTIKPGMVNDNQALLESIYQHIESGEEMIYSCSVHQLSGLSYQIHQLLYAAKILTDECNGRYSMLRDRTKISMNPSRGGILISPKTSVASLTADGLRPAVYNEVEALNSLIASGKAEGAIEFIPSDSFHPGRFAGYVEKQGYHVVPNVKTGKPHFQPLTEDKVMAFIKKGTAPDAEASEDVELDQDEELAAIIAELKEVEARKR